MRVREEKAYGENQQPALLLGNRRDGAGQCWDWRLGKGKAGEEMEYEGVQRGGRGVAPTGNMASLLFSKIINAETRKMGREKEKKNRY